MNNTTIVQGRLRVITSIQNWRFIRMNINVHVVSRGFYSGWQMVVRKIHSEIAKNRILTMNEFPDL